MRNKTSPSDLPLMYGQHQDGGQPDEDNGLIQRSNT